MLAAVPALLGELDETQRRHWLVLARRQPLWVLCDPVDLGEVEEPPWLYITPESTS